MARFPIKSETLWLLTVGFLALPVAIFAVGWLSPVWAALLIGSLVAGMYFRPKPGAETPASVPWWSFLLLASGCIGIGILAGVGGFSYQDGDYSKHNAILADLFRREWPVTYSIIRNDAEHPATLVYYIAYYLPTAVVGKVAGWEALRISIVLWTASGMFITCLWCLRFSRGAIWAPLAFLAFGGLDIFGMLLGIKVFHWMPELWIEHRQMEWWTGFSFGNYPGHSTHLFWAPQHALPGWLITAAVIHRIRSKTLDGCLLLAALAPLWSPLIALGLLPIGFAGLLANKGKGALAISNLAALPLLAAMILFFAARGVQGVPFPPVPAGWNDVIPWKLAATFLLEVLPWTLLLLVPTNTPKSDRILIISCALFLAILPLWRIGAFNDLMMRSSLPAFATLSYLLLSHVGVASTVWKKAALVTLIAGSGGLAFDLYRHHPFAGNADQHPDFSSPEMVSSLPVTPDLSGLLSQYLGSPQSFFFRELARPLPLASDSITYSREEPPPGALESQDRMQVELRRRFERGERSMEFLQQYGTVSYIQGEMWESMLAFETMVKFYPQDPNARLKLASLLASSGIKAYHVRARAEFDTARRLAGNSPEFERFTEDFRKLLDRTTEPSK
jgi:hypothetical protein